MNHVMTLWMLAHEVVIQNVEEFLKLNPSPGTNIKNQPKKLKYHSHFNYNSRINRQNPCWLRTPIYCKGSDGVQANVILYQDF